MKPRAPSKDRRAFTLTELLISVALIALLTTLLIPSVRGLMGVAGARGGVSILSGALEQARFAAMQSGVTAYVGFPFTDGAISTDARYSSVIVFRDLLPGETSPVPGFLMISRWLRMPRGVYIAAGANFPTDKKTVSGFPKLALQSPTSLSVLPFDRFGRLKSSGSEVTLIIGEKAQPDGDFVGRKSTLAIQPLTGRIVVTE